MIQLDSVSKIYKTKNGEVRSMDELNFSVNPSEFVIIRGPSGSGKSTLLLTLGAMLRPTNGIVKVFDTDLYSLSVPQRAQFRAQHIGFIFQMFHLIPYLTVLENLLMAPSKQNGFTEQQAFEWLDRVGLADRATHKPSQLSAGERQRTAVCRAFMNQPDLILADEPTGNLDPDNAHAILTQLSEYHKNGATVIVVTHSHEGDEFADRTVLLKNGKIEPSQASVSS